VPKSWIFYAWVEPYLDDVLDEDLYHASNNWMIDMVIKKPDMKKFTTLCVNYKKFNA
jgi:hypothetical protein